MNTAYPYRNRNLSGLGLFWDENLSVPTIDLDDAPLYDGEIYDTRDYWATGESWNSIDSTILDARDAWAEYGGAPVVTSTGGGFDWSFSDILRTGAGIAQEVLRYQTAQLPGGGRVLTRYDQYGNPITGGRTITVQSGGLSQFINQNLPFILLGGVGLVALAASGSKK